MPAVVQADNIADLVATTQKNLGRMQWTEIASDLQEYHALRNILKKEKVTFQSGIGLQWNVLVNDNGSAQNVGLFGDDSVGIVDGMQTATAPWRHTTANYAFERREVAMNRDPARIVDLVKTRRAMAMISLAKRMEISMWSKPADSNDQTEPFGIPYWVTTSATAAFGFNGTNPTGFSSGAGGLSSTTYTAWANGTGTYSAYTKSSMVALMREAATKTHFVSPVDLPSYSRGERYAIYAGYTVIQKLEEIAEQQNDNLGKDVAAMDGLVTFRKIPCLWVPYLDSSTTTGIIYGINWGELAPVVLQGEYLVESAPEKVPGKHTTMQSFVDLSWNLRCTNRRKQWVIYKA